MEDVLASAEYARTTAFAIDALLTGDTLKETNKSDPEVIQNLARLAIRLQQFRQHSDQLGQWLQSGAASKSPKIQALVAELARECRRVSVIVFNEIDKLSSDGSVDTLGAGILAEYDGVLAAFTRVFVFFAQILSGGGEKDSKLNHPDAHQLVQNAQRASEKVVSSRSSLLDLNNPRLPTVKVSV
ncbi:hypothetical protein V8F20_006454 [Naviculisporaceae sp. PSN 640]